MIARELIKKIRKIEIHTSRLVNDQLAGHYHSVFKGRGMAFEEVRKYQPGDDIRSIDWNVSARMNDVFIKLFVEEREMTVMLLVDMSASGLFGTAAQTKREVAAEMAAVIAFSAIKNNDRVGLVIFTDQVEKFVPPKKGKKHVLRVITEILSFRPLSRRTNLSAALEFLARVGRRHAIAFMFSDFLTAPEDGDLDPQRDALPDQLEHTVRITRRKHDLIPVAISDPLEEEIPRGLGLLSLADLETGERLLIDASGAEIDAYNAYVRRRRHARDQLFRRLKVDHINIRTDQPYIDELIAFFVRREKRQRR
ncbi:MAG: DUF58 domain-containing protein [Deltaproteobacteria bacterium]|nr:DUF58 domain-containing protein [Deltaproteobacteria bacterium]